MNRLNIVLPLILTAALVGAILPTTNGQETNTSPASPGASIDSLVAEALTRNPELKFYEAELTAAKAARKTAGRLANPEVSGDFGEKRVNGGGDSDEGVAWSVSVMQPFEWPGRMGLRKAIANRDIELAELGYARFKVALAGRMRTLAYGFYAAQEKAAAATEVAARFEALREVLVQRDPAGLTPLLETRVIEATELNAQRKAGAANLSAQTALIELNQLRGATPGAPLVMDNVQPVFAPPHGTELLLALARTNNFEIRLRAVELAQHGIRVDLAKNERFPPISVGPSYSEEKAGDRERIISVGLSLPLPLWNRNSDNIEAARVRQLQAEVSFAVTQREIERHVLEAALTYETKLGEMAKWRPDSVQHFKEAAELADRHYRLGAVPISTYVELQQQYLEAVEGLLDTKREALEAAAQLELLTGMPLPLVSTSATEEKK